MVNREELVMVGMYTYYRGDRFMDLREKTPLDNRIFSLAGHFGEKGLVIQYDRDLHTEELSKETFGNLISTGEFELIVVSAFQQGDRLVSKFTGKEIVVLATSPKKSDQDDLMYYFVEVYSYQNNISYEVMSEDFILKMFVEEGLVEE